jgi:hypothetical protein
MTEHCVRIFFEEHFVDSHVHRGDHLLGVADQLPVQVLVEQVDVTGVDVQVGLLQIVDLTKQINKILKAINQHFVFKF